MKAESKSVWGVVEVGEMSTAKAERKGNIPVKSRNVADDIRLLKSLERMG